MAFLKLTETFFQNIRFPHTRVLHAFWLKGGPMPPLGFAKGGHFEVKDGHPDFLQITLFFLNVVLLLYLKLFHV